MKEIYKQIVSELEPKQLEDIFEVNKIRLTGFRQNSKTSQMKINKMRQELQTKQYIDQYFKDLINYYKDKQLKDYSWALVTSITEEELNRKIEQQGMGEVLLALLSADKRDIIEHLFLKKQEKLIKEDTFESQVESKSHSSNLNDLREIIRRLEGEVEFYKSTNLKVTSENNKLKSEIREMKSNYKEIKQNYSTLKIEKTDIYNELKGKNSRFENLENNFKQLQQENLEYERTLREKDLLLNDFKKSRHPQKILVLCDQYFRDNQNKINQNIEDLHYNFISVSYEELNQSLSDYHNLIIMKFLLTHKELDTIHQSDVYKRFNNVGRVIIIENMSEYRRYNENVRVLINDE